METVCCCCHCSWYLSLLRITACWTLNSVIEMVTPSNWTIMEPSEFGLNFETSLVLCKMWAICANVLLVVENGTGAYGVIHRISSIDVELTLCIIVVYSIDVLFRDTEMLSERIRQLKVQRLAYNDKDILLYKWPRERNSVTKRLSPNVESYRWN